MNPDSWFNDEASLSRFEAAVMWTVAFFVGVALGVC